jgi:atypical dual specificity phosphatase
MFNCNQILPELYVGSCPKNTVDVERLIHHYRITAVLNLQTDQDLQDKGVDWTLLAKNYRKLDITVKRVLMRDFDQKDQRRVLPDAVRVLATLLGSGHFVYLHCTAGTGRSPLVAMAYLYWCCDFPLTAAIRHVKTRRPCSPYVDLLESSRRDVLANDRIQNEISRRASLFLSGPGFRIDHPRRARSVAEREVLKETLGGCIDENNN